MAFRETDLPGVGKKYSLILDDERILTLIIHNTGKREIYILEEEEEEPVCVFTLSEEEAKELGFLLAGTTYQPVAPEKMEMFMREMVMEWVRIGKRSALVDKKIAESQIRKRTGASVVAIIRGEEMIVSPDPYEAVIRSGDTVVVVGTRNHIKKFLEFCGDCST